MLQLIQLRFDSFSSHEQLSFIQFIVLKNFFFFCIKKQCRTDTVRDNGFNPSWEKDFEFTITDSENLLLRFVVMDSNFDRDDFIGQCVIPLNCLAQGYRDMSLFDNKNHPIPIARIFIHSQVVNPKDL